MRIADKERLTLLLSSYRELSSARQLALSAMLLALSVALGRFSIYLTPTLKISVSYLPIALIGMYAGPCFAMLAGALNDVLGALLFPAGAYFPGYTLTSLLTGLVFGVFFYKRRPGIGCIALARGLIVVLLHMGLNTCWSALFSGDAFLVLLPARALKSLIQYPIDLFLLLFVTRLAARVRAPG